jgi:2-amino-4-hydroxy-6-hydroxymethyldihydropteridine diphosphokinase
LTADADVTLLRSSSLFQTSPVDFTEQPEFLNSVIEVETTLTPTEILERIQEIESAVNNAKPVPKGPRVVDLDILLCDDLVLSDNSLTVPHEAICRRRFVLVPLLELAPDLRDPRDHRPYREHLAQLNDASQKVELYHE